MLTSNEIKRQMECGNILIDGLHSEALKKPNSCGISIGDTLYTFDYAVVDTRQANGYLAEIATGNLDKLRRVKIPKDGLLLEPRKVYLAKTTEHIKTNGYVPVLHGRTSLSLLGLSIELNSGYAEDNYDGNFLLSIICTKPTRIYPNIEVGNLTFFKSLDNQSSDYGMLSGKEIQSRMATGDIIIEPQDKIVINPNSVNLSLHNEIGYYTEPILDLRINNPIEFVQIGDNGIILSPDRIYVARSNEWTETQKLIPMMSGRSSLGRLGYHVHCSAGMGSVGYRGYWHMGVRPTIPIKIYPDMKCCQLYYFTPEGEIGSTYNGTMQGLDGRTLGSQYYKKMLTR